jgi:hypothetical protein
VVAEGRRAGGTLNWYVSVAAEAAGGREELLRLGKLEWPRKPVEANIPISGPRLTGG